MLKKPCDLIYEKDGGGRGIPGHKTDTTCKTHKTLKIHKTHKTHKINKIHMTPKTSKTPIFIKEIILMSIKEFPFNF